MNHIYVSKLIQTIQKFILFISDCVECMACSDNTIRAGLTPKFKDVKTLISSLSFKMSPPPYFLAKKLRPGLVEYRPPVKEFAVHEIKVEFVFFRKSSEFQIHFQFPVSFSKNFICFGRSARHSTFLIFLFFSA